MWTRSQRHEKRGLYFDLRMACAELMCIGLLCVWPSAARTDVPVRGSEPSTRLLTVAEGRTIVDAAWQQERPRAGMRDCSHFVHEIYENAGFGYRYASSFEIYAGSENFGRVKFPHPGDLIAWPGHVGIVVDPLQHRFYSLVRTGLEAQDYRSAYWRSRGRPRFYRYKVEAARLVNTANIRGTQRSAKSARQRTTSTAIDERMITSEDSANVRPAEMPEKAEEIYGPPAPPENRGADAAEAPFAMPASVMVSTGNSPPTREEVEEGISELSDARGSVLRTSDPLKSQLPVVVVEQFRVERVDIKRDHGWSRVVVDSKVLISGGEVKVKRRHEKARWELRRTEAGWEAIMPQDRTYVAQDVAVKNLAEQLARLTKSDGATQHQPAVLQQESQLASLLNALLESNQKR